MEPSLSTASSGCGIHSGEEEQLRLEEERVLALWKERTKTVSREAARVSPEAHLGGKADCA